MKQFVALLLNQLKLLPIICLGIFSAFQVYAQTEYPSIHKQQLEE